jgi:hypothetical protein
MPLSGCTGCGYLGWCARPGIDPDDWFQHEALDRDVGVDVSLRNAITLRPLIASTPLIRS